MDMNKRNQILDSALKLFSVKGYDGVGVMEICNAAAVTKPTLYYFFSSKDGLYDALWQEKFEPFQTELQAAADYIPRPSDYEHDVLPVLVKIIDTYTRFAKTDPAFFSMISTLNFAPKEASGIIKTIKYRDIQLTILQNMFKAMAGIHGNLVGKEQILAVSLLGMIFSFVSLDSNTQVSSQHIARQFMHGIFS